MYIMNCYDVFIMNNDNNYEIINELINDHN